MAEGIRISKLDDAMQKLRETTDRQQDLLIELIHRIAVMENKYEQIFKKSAKKWKRHQDYLRECVWKLVSEEESNQDPFA